MTDQSLATQLQELEVSLLRSSTRRSALAAELLADEFVEYGSSGSVYNRQQVITALQEESTVEISATGFSMKLLTPQAALLTYRACRHSEPPVYSLRSSIWLQRDGRWQMVFHQGTVTGENE